MTNDIDRVPADTPPAWGVGDDVRDPRSPEDPATYSVDETAATDAEEPAPLSATSTWLLVAFILLLAFAAILAWGILSPALS